MHEMSTNNNIETPTTNQESTTTGKDIDLDNYSKEELLSLQYKINMHVNKEKMKRAKKLEKSLANLNQVIL